MLDRARLDGRCIDSELLPRKGERFPAPQTLENRERLIQRLLPVPSCSERHLHLVELILPVADPKAEDKATLA